MISDGPSYRRADNTLPEAGVVNLRVTGVEQNAGVHLTGGPFKTDDADLGGQR
jgi:hypothetical protein